MKDEKKTKKQPIDELAELRGRKDTFQDITEQNRAEEALRKSQERSDALFQISNRLASVHNTDEILDLIVNESARLLGANAAYMRLLEGDGLVASAATESAIEFLAELAVARPTNKVEEGESLTGHVMATKEPLVIDDGANQDVVSQDTSHIRQKYEMHGTAAVPLISNENPIGVLVVVDTRVRRFTEDEVSLLTAFADQAALALDKARLLSEAEARERQAAQLYEVTTQLASSPDMDSVLDLIATKAVELIGSEASALWKYDAAKDELEVVSGHNVPSGWAKFRIKPGDATTGSAFQERRPVWSRDISTDPSWIVSNSISFQATRSTNIAGALAVPVIIRDEVYGALNTFFYEPHDFTDVEIQLLRTLADSAAVAIGNARFIDQTQQAREAAEAREREAIQLQEVTNQLASSPDMDSVLELITEKAKELLKSDISVIAKYDEARDGLIMPAWSGPGLSQMEEMVLRPGDGTSGRAYSERKPVWSRDFLADEGMFPDGEFRDALLKSVGSRSGLSVPIIIREDVYGVLVTHFFTTHDFTEGEIQLLQTLADSAAVAINNARFIESTQQAKDEATQLYEITEQLASSPDMNSVLDLIAMKTVDLLGADGGAILRYDATAGALTPARVQSKRPQFFRSGMAKPGAGVSGTAFQEKRPVWTRDITADQEWSEVDVETETSINQNGLKAVLAVPIQIRDEVYGALNAHFLVAHEFTEGEIQLLQTLADSASVAIGNTRFIEETQKARDVAESHEREAYQLQEVTSQLASSQDMESVLDLIVQKAAELLGSEASSIFTYDNEKGGLGLTREHNLLTEEDSAEDYFFRPGAGTIGRAFQDRKPVWKNDLHQNAEQEYPDPAVRATVLNSRNRAALSAPIIIRDEVYGCLSANYYAPHQFGEPEAQLLQTLADSAAVAIGNARFIEQTQRARDEATQLYEITEQLASSPNMQSVLELITEKAKELLKSDTSAIARYDGAQGGLVMPGWSGEHFSAGVDGTIIAPGVSTSGRAYAERRPVWSHDYLADESLASDDAVKERVIQVGLRAGLSVPIIIRDEVYGVIVTHFFTTHNFTDGEIQLLQTLADSAAVAIGNAQFIEQTQRARDEATELYEITEQLASSPDMDSVLDLITTKAAELLGSQGSAILRFDEERGVLLPATEITWRRSWLGVMPPNRETAPRDALFRKDGPSGAAISRSTKT